MNTIDINQMPEQAQHTLAAIQDLRLKKLQAGATLQNLVMSQLSAHEQANQTVAKAQEFRLKAL